MTPFQWHTTTNKSIWEHRLGEKFVHILEVLHHADLTEC